MDPDHFQDDSPRQGPNGDEEDEELPDEEDIGDWDDDDPDEFEPELPFGDMG